MQLSTLHRSREPIMRFQTFKKNTAAFIILGGTHVSMALASAALPPLAFTTILPIPEVTTVRYPGQYLPDTRPITCIKTGR